VCLVGRRAWSGRAFGFYYYHFNFKQRSATSTPETIHRVKLWGSFGIGKHGLYANVIAIFFCTMKKLLIAFLIIIFGVGLCFIKVTPNRTVFGSFAGECDGNCATMYEVTGGQIRVDTTSFWKSKLEPGKLVVLSQRSLGPGPEEDYNSYKISVPLIMLLDPRRQFGCPDCGDWGGYYFEFEFLGITRDFMINKGDEPIYYHDMTYDIDDKIVMIKEDLKTKYGR
jgi:hypothetical protein